MRRNELVLELKQFQEELEKMSQWNVRAIQTIQEMIEELNDKIK